MSGFRPMQPWSADEVFYPYDWDTAADEISEDAWYAYEEAQTRRAKALKRRRGFWRYVVMSLGIVVFLVLWALLVNWLVPLPDSVGPNRPQMTNGAFQAPEAPYGPVRGLS